MTPQLGDLLADHLGGHTDLQMERFIVVKAGGTLWGQYQQCLRELHKRAWAIVDIVAAHEEAQHQAGSWRARASLIRTRQAMATTVRELLHFYRIGAALKAAIGPVDQARAAQLDRETWIHRFRRRAALERITAGGVSQGTIEAVLSLPEDDARDLLEIVGDDDQAKAVAFEAAASVPPIPASDMTDAAVVTWVVQALGLPTSVATAALELVCDQSPEKIATHSAA